MAITWDADHQSNRVRYSVLEIQEYQELLEGSADLGTIEPWIGLMTLVNVNWPFCA